MKGGRERGRERGRDLALSFAHLLHPAKGLVAAFGPHGDDHDAAHLGRGGRKGGGGDGGLEAKGEVRMDRERGRE